MDLRVFPLTVTVPSSWKLDMANGVLVVLGGRTPGGEVQISLSKLPLETVKDVDLMIADAPHEAERDTSHTTRLNTTTINGLKVFETIVLPKGAATQTSDTTQVTATALPTLIGNMQGEPNLMLSATTLPADALATTTPTTTISPDAATALQTPAPAPPATPTAVLSITDDNSNLISWNVIYYVPQGTDLIPCDLAILGLTPQQFAVDESFLREILSSAKLSPGQQTP
jgi:hypothetical protein